jgi:hypothetical protein
MNEQTARQLLANINPGQVDAMYRQIVIYLMSVDDQSGAMVLALGRALGDVTDGIQRALGMPADDWIRLIVAASRRPAVGEPEHRDPTVH